MYTQIPRSTGLEPIPFTSRNLSPVGIQSNVTSRKCISKLLCLHGRTLKMGQIGK